MDKNLFGVSAQVTAPGVLVFGQIFRTLRAGNQGRVEHRSEEFARTATHFGSAIHLKAASTPATADHGRHRGVKKCCGLALRDDVERNLDIDFRVQVHRHRVRAHGLDVRLG